MKRRDFITKSTSGVIGAGIAGCSSVTVKRELSPYTFDKKVRKPAGTMPTGDIGTTGIRVSRFGFGSHIRRDIVKFEKEREWMVREAFDLGINLFDVYDREGESYQYEPIGRYLAPIINDVVISISILPWEGRSLEQEFERDLRLFGRDYIDMVRIHSYSSESDNWYQWEKLFKFKEQGKIRAVGIPCHNVKNLKEPLGEFPIDYVIFPYNFYHNWTWLHKGMELENFDPLVKKLREKGIGVISMKPFAGDHLVTPFRRLTAGYENSGEFNYAKACLRYVINSGLDVDTTLGGMYYPYHVYENADAYFNPDMSDNERRVLKKLRTRVKGVTKNMLPPHYHFLEDWVPDSRDDLDLYEKA